jgi:hypothetical protein
LDRARARRIYLVVEMSDDEIPTVRRKRLKAVNNNNNDGDDNDDNGADGDVNNDDDNTDRTQSPKVETAVGAPLFVSRVVEGGDLNAYVRGR